MASETITRSLLALTLCWPAPVYAAGEADYSNGVAAYNKHDYKLASQYLQRAVTAGLNDSSAYIYLGHSYTGVGDRSHAVQAYVSTIEKFPGTPPAQLALQCLQKIDPLSAAKYAAAARASAPVAPGAAVSAPVKREPYINRLVIVPPIQNHPAVSQAMIATVKNCMHRLPTNAYKILDEGGATVNLAPNIEDKWPGSGDGEKPGSRDTTMGEETGRTYGHDSYVYEREKMRGVTTLKDARGQSEIAATTYHEIGHAVDDCCGIMSTHDAKLKEAFEQDLADMGSDTKSKIDYYTVPSEATAEILAGLFGAEGHSTALVIQSFPRLKAWLKNRLHI